MKLDDFIEALKSASKEFKKVTGKEMEIFDIDFNSYEYEGIHIEAVAEVVYDHDDFNSSKTGKYPYADVAIKFEVQDGKIEDRDISLENVRGAKRGKR